MDELAYIGIYPFLFAEIVALTALLLSVITRFDTECRLKITLGVKQTIILYSLIVTVWTATFLRHWTFPGTLTLGILAAYLLVSSITDYQTKEVYDFLHLVGAVPGMVMFLVTRPEGGRILSLFLFSALQLLFFMRFYGEADGLAFLSCSLYEACFGAGLLTYLLHMLIVYLILGIVQAFRNNINKRGRLKEEVALIPYIAFSVWFFL